MSIQELSLAVERFDRLDTLEKSKGISEQEAPK